MPKCKSGSIVDVDCVYEDGKFMLSSFDACVPDLFTVRFRATADYKAGDVIVFREKELPVRTPGMDNATTGIFKTGAIVHADIDLVSRRAFVWMGGAGGALPNLSYEEQFAGFYDEDGFKVYLKTVDLGRAVVGSKTTPHNIPNLRTVVDDCFRWYHINAHHHYVGKHSNGNDDINIYYTDSAVVWRSPLNHFTGIVTIYYTCTDR